MARGLLSLPPELLVDILGRLPASDLVSLRLVCKFLYEAIASSARLQLVLELYAFQVVVGPSVVPVPSDQLAALRRFCDGWTAIRPIRKEVFEHERLVCLLSNGYIIGTPGSSGDPVHFWELPSHVLGRYRMELQTATYTMHEGRTRAIGIGPFQDLVIRLVTNPNGSLGCHVFLETFSTGMPHPEAAKPHLVFSEDIRLEGTMRFEGDLCDDILLVLFHANFGSPRGTAIWNWRTGERLFHSNDEIQSHKLLSPSLVLQLTTHQHLRVFDLSQRRIVARLGLPPTHHKIWQLMSALPRDTPATRMNAPISDRRGWLSGPANDIIIFKSRETTDPDHAEELQGVRMVVSKSSLLRVIALYAGVGDATYIPWRQWNSTARVFLGLHSLSGEPSGSRWGLLVNEEAFRAMEKGSWNGTRVYWPEEERSSNPRNRRRHVTILDFNPRVIRRASADTTIESDTSIIRTIQHATTVVAPDIFLTPIESSLPFRISCSKEPVDYQDVQIDFENLVGFTTSQKRTRIEIWNF